MRHRRWLILAAGVIALSGALIALRRFDQPGDTLRQVATTTMPPGRPLAAGQLVIAEVHETWTALIGVSPDDLNDRRQLLRVDHAARWAPRAALAPGGEWLAYTLLPPDARNPDTEAVLWVISLTRREPRPLAKNIDLRVPPQWSMDAARIAYQRVTRGLDGDLITTLEEVNVYDGKALELVSAPATVRLFPAGYAANGRFMYVRFERDGAWLHEVNSAAKAARAVARIAEGPARDFKVTPDGHAVAFLALAGWPARYHALTVDVRTGQVAAIMPSIERAEDVGVAWKPGDPPLVTVGTIGSGAQTGRLLSSGEPATPGAPERGFEAPVAWSPDGRFLYVRAFSGVTADDPGRETPALVDSEGVRRPVVAAGPIDFVGWATYAP